MTTTAKPINFIWSASFFPLLDVHDRYLLLYGGRGSGKSEFAARKVIKRCLFEGGHRILVLRKVRSRCGQSVVRVILTVLQENGIRYRHNETKREITFMSFTGRPSVILYDGLDDPDKIKSIKGITGAWIEEATEFAHRDFEFVNLSIREITGHYQQIIMTFNPDEARAPWIKQMFFNGIVVPHTGAGSRSGSYLHHSTVKDNPIKAMRNAYVSRLSEINDPVWIKIFREGLWAVARGVIYQPFKQIPLSQYPESPDEKVAGLDFGYNNPTALIQVDIHDQECFLRELIYETRLTTTDLIGKMKAQNVDRKMPIYADPSAPDKIDEIKRAGFNIRAASGGKGSVNAGILFCKSLSIISNERNEHINDENKTYKWREDKNGEPMDEPAKFDDHALDAMRYVLFSHLAKRKKAGFRVSKTDMY